MLNSALVTRWSHAMVVMSVGPHDVLHMCVTVSCGKVIVLSPSVWGRSVRGWPNRSIGAVTYWTHIAGCSQCHQTLLSQYWLSCQLKVIIPSILTTIQTDYTYFLDFFYARFIMKYIRYKHLKWGRGSQGTSLLGWIRYFVLFFLFSSLPNVRHYQQVAVKEYSRDNEEESRQLKPELMLEWRHVPPLVVEV